MSKKKPNSFLGKIKGKFSKNAEDDLIEDEFIEENEINPDDDLQFSDDDSDDATDIEDALMPSLDDLNEVDEDDEEDEEEFIASELKIGDAQKEELENISDAPLLHEGEGENPLEKEGVEAATGDEAIIHEEVEYEEDDQQDWQEEYDDFPSPSQTGKEKFLAALTSVKTKARSLIKKNDSDNEVTKLSTSSKGSDFNSIKELNWDEVVSTIFSPASRKLIHKSFIISLFAFGTYFTGKTIALSLRPKEDKKTTIAKKLPQAPRENFRASTNLIKRANIFNARPQEGELPKRKNVVEVEQPKICKDAKKTSKLPLKLVNTIVLQDSVKSVASVQIRGNSKLKDIREGEKLDKFAEIGRIERLRLIFKNLKSGECEFIETKRKKSRLKPIKIVSAQKGKKLLSKHEGIVQAGNKFKIKNKVREELLSNMSKVLTQARAIQIKNPDGTLSFKMTEIVPGSIYSQLDIQDNDTISAINGKKFTNLNDLMSLFGRIRDIPQFTITKKRDGAETTVDYNFED